MALSTKDVIRENVRASLFTFLEEHLRAKLDQEGFETALENYVATIKAGGTATEPNRSDYETTGGTNLKEQLYTDKSTLPGFESSSTSEDTSNMENIGILADAIVDKIVEKLRDEIVSNLQVKMYDWVNALKSALNTWVPISGDGGSALKTKIATIVESLEDGVK